MTSPLLNDAQATGRTNVRRAFGRPAEDRPATTTAPVTRSGTDLARILMWTRDGLTQAPEPWPSLVEDRPAADLMHERERQNREMTADGDLRVVMVMITPDELADFARRTNGDPLEKATRNALLVERFEAGDGQVWPPERNAPCWCGSGAKYKKCCGTPSI